MKKTLGIILECLAVCCGLFMIIHRRVIKAYLTDSEMPEAPEWHKKMFCMHKEEEEA